MIFVRHNCNNKHEASNVSYVQNRSHVTGMQHDLGKAHSALQGGARTMFRMIFAIVIGVMEKTPRRERRRMA